MPLLFALAVLAVALTAAAASAALKLSSPISWVLAVYLLASAEIVLLTEVLSPPRLVGPTGYLVGEAGLLAAAVTAWHVRGRPRPPLPRVDLAAVRRHPVLAGLAAVVGVAACYQAFVVLGTPPNNGDSMSQHLSRAVRWLHHGGVFWIPDTHTERQNEWLPVGEIEVLYTFAFLHRDTVAAMTQLIAEAGLALAVVGCARRLGFSRSASVFAGLVTATLPQVALQSVTTQVDLLVASFVAAAAYFVRSWERPDLPLAGVALGLALGTKATALLALPALALLALVSLPRRLLVRAATCAAVGFVAFGAYGYVQNVVETGRPLGEGKPARGYRPEITLRGTASSLGKMGFRLVDFPGYHLPPAVRRPVARAGEGAFAALRIPIDPPESTPAPLELDVNISAHEDIAWFGPLGFFLLAPLALIYAIRAGLRRESAVRGVHAVALPVYAVLLALAYKDGPWYGRYLLAAVALTLPLAAVVYRYRPVAAAVATVGLTTLALTHIFNANKPTGIGSARATWHLSRSEAQSLEIPGYERVIDAVDRVAPDDARLGIVMEEQDYDHPFFGVRLERRLVGLEREGALEEAERRGLRWVVVGREIPPPPTRAGWSQLRFSWYGTVVVRDEGGATT